MSETGLTRKRPNFQSFQSDYERPTSPLTENEQSNIHGRELDENNKLLNQNQLASKPVSHGGQGSTGVGNHATYLKDNFVWSSFPFGERAGLGLKNFALCKNQTTFVDHIDTTKPSVVQTEIDKMKDQAVRINILETSQLELDRYVIHPFVKMHIVDIHTGRYVAKSTAKCVVGPNETMTVTTGHKNFAESGIDFIPPFATNCCDLRLEGIARARWNYSIILNEEASYLYDPKHIILFEILDFSKDLLKQNSNMLDSNNHYRIAWGYLRLAGLAKNHIGLSKIQLFKYKFDPSYTATLNIQKIYKRIPFVYFDFIWPNKTNYEGYLNVQVNGIIKPPLTRVQRTSKNIYEIEEDDRGFNLSTGFKKKIVSQSEDLDDPEFVKKQKMLLRRRRFNDDECRIPTHVLFRFQSAPLGCFRLSFSPNGKYLAAACTYENSKTVIKIFNVEEGELKYTLKGHKNIIHDLNWHPTNKYLVSCSSDFSIKVWRIPEVEINEIDEEESERQLFVCELLHPAYVYSAKFYRDRDPNCLIIASACFDAKVRVWRVDLENEIFYRSDLISEDVLTIGMRGQEAENLLEHRHPNILKFDDEGRLYIGDSLGSIHIWDVHVKYNKVSVSKLKELSHSELNGDAINTLNILPYEKKRLLVHSRDNCIRSIDYGNPSGLRILGRFFGSKSAKIAIRSVVSPDGQNVLSGSEDGKLYLWDFHTNEPYNTEHLGLSIVGPATDVDWNQGYHMFAVSGFGDEYPILVFASELEEGMDLNRVLGKMKDYEETSMRSDHVDHNELTRKRLDRDDRNRDRDEVRSPLTAQSAKKRTFGS